MPKGFRLRTELSPEAQAIEAVLNVKDKVTGKIVPFTLNSVQRQYDSQWTGRDKYNQEAATRDIVNKARQQGVSALITAYILIMALNKPYFRAIILTHVADSSSVLLEKIKFYLKNPQKDAILRMGKKAFNYEVVEEETQKDNWKTIKLENGSSIVITTAMNKNTAIGDTADAIHASEVAKWPKSCIQGLKTGLLQTLPPTGHLWYESTGEGVDGFFYDLTMQAYLDATGESPHTQHFFAWLQSPEYSKLFKNKEQKAYFMANLRDDLEERDVIQRARENGYPDPTAEQLYWRRDKILSDFIQNGVPNLKLFKQEYPQTLMECFQSAIHSIFQSFNWLEFKSEWKYDNLTGVGKLSGHPRSGCTYVGGVDIGAGIGKDYTVLDIVCTNTQEQVLQHRSNVIDPVTAAHTHAQIAWPYRTFLVPEANNHGLAYCVQLQDIYPVDLIYQEQREESKLEEEAGLHITGLGFKTTTGKKPTWINKLAHFLGEMDFRLYSKFTAMELFAFTETDSGKLEGGNDSNDDCVISLMLCFIGMSSLYLVPLGDYTVFKEMEMEEAKNKGLGVMDSIITPLNNGYGIPSNLLGMFN